MKSNIKFILIITLFLSYIQNSFGQSKSNSNDLEINFKSPPTSSKPRTWMHAMSGNMSKVGLTKDLEAIADAGLGGIILFNVSHGIPKGNVVFNSPEHIALTAHAAAECERLDLSFGVHNCDGWTSSGGPWVTAEHAMKLVTYTQKVVEGGKLKTKLQKPTQRGGFYRDIAVLAYPALKGDIEDAENKPKISSSQKNLNLSLLTDGRYDARINLEVEPETVQNIDFTYQKRFTLKSLLINVYHPSKQNGKIFLKTSEDGITYKTIQELKPLNLVKYERSFEVSFEGLTSKYFRIEFGVPIEISEINLSNIKRINETLAHTSMHKIEDFKLPEIKAVDSDNVIRKNDILNLTASMDAEGNIIADLPQGKWTIMRFGYTITEAVNVPASEEGTGWEVDKMSRESFKTFYEGYVRNVIKASKPVAPNALQYIEIDSYEVGGQNWTKDYDKDFKKELGYDLIPFLPLYAGKYVDDAETANRVLWDVRNFNSKMITKNYFDYFTELCHQDGLISYVEPYSFNGDFNELDAAKNVDIPMGEFWMHQKYQTGTAVSGARIYGKNIVSAEAFTAKNDVNWKSHPGSIKLSGDRAWALGVNEFMFHRYAHQANTHVKPGMTMSGWGSHIDRTQTWWDNAGKSWFKYLARGQFLLRKGIPVSNLLVFVGDGSPNSIIQEHMFNPKLPKHINFDCINADALINRINVENKKMVLPNGISYYALHLKNIKNIKLATLKKIATLSEQGIVIIGEKPDKLGGYNIKDEEVLEFNKLVASIWSKPTTYSDGDWDDIFKSNNIPTDLFIEGGEKINYIHRKTDNEDIYFFYNPDNKERNYICTFNVDGKIPELWNQTNGEITKLAAFTHENGQTKTLITLPAEGSTFIVFREKSAGVTSIIPTAMVGNQSIKATLSTHNKLKFEINENGIHQVKLSSGNSKSVESNKLPEDIQISSDWNVSFPDMKAEQKNVTFPKLIDWTTHENEGIKHYSGTATYKNEFTVDRNALGKDIKLTLDLGKVNICARVIVNGKDLGVVWKAPYLVDITDVLVKGKNTLQIEVTNQWTNRLIGDEYFPNETEYKRDGIMPDWYLNNEPAKLKQRSTFTLYQFYKKDSELLPAGLVGPVKLSFSRLVKISNK